MSNLSGNGEAMDASYEFFDHTADIGIRVTAPTLAGLIEPAGDGLYAVIGRLVASEDVTSHVFELAGPDAATLLRDYLAELLLMFEQDHRMVTAAKVLLFDADRLTVTAGTQLVDQHLSVYDREVKAVTYHELDVRAVPGGFEATVIVDI